jgi:GAG-pre-integrase domain
VSKITEDLNCSVLIFPSFCIFHDILTWEIIGRGSKREGLYYLNELKIGNALSVKGNFMELRTRVWLWDKRLGHSSFGYMKKLPLTSFLNLENKIFICETCIKAKSHRNPYPSSVTILKKNIRNRVFILFCFF